MIIIIVGRHTRTIKWSCNFVIMLLTVYNELLYKLINNSYRLNSLGSLYYIWCVVIILYYAIDCI